MIDWLKVTKAAYFYRRKKRLSNRAVTEAFRAIRQAAENPSQNIFSHVRQASNGASWSALSFFFDRDPAFLEAPRANPKERVCGYVLLIEHANYVVLFKSNLDFPTSFKTEYLQKVGADRIETAIARADATFEQIRLRNMAASRSTLRSKTLEADNLENAVGPSGASRFVTRGYKVRRGQDHHSATPTTGLISTRSDRVGYDDLIDWTKSVVSLLDEQGAAISTFISGFARPIDLSSMPAGVVPTYVAVDTAALREELFDLQPAIRLVRKSGAGIDVLAKPEIDAVLGALDREFAVQKVKGELRVTVAPRNEHVGEINLGKSSISLRRLSLAEVAEIYVESTNPAEQEESRLPIRRYIDHNDLFTVLFSDFSIVYIDGALYRDGTIMDGGKRVLSYIRADASLNNAIDEKGNFTPNQPEFDGNTVFRIVVDSVARGDQTLVCDDLGDEWADFIGVNNGSSPKTISFYHAKHGAPSLGAGHMHIAVSQATKNLGRMALHPNEVAGKLQKWAERYANDNAVTSIVRTVRGNVPTLAATMSDAAGAPDTIRRVFIVTSSLSRGQLEGTLTAIQRGEAAPTPHFVQLYWLLMSYFSACTEVGAYPYIICRD